MALSAWSRELSELDSEGHQGRGFGQWDPMIRMHLTAPTAGRATCPSQQARGNAGPVPQLVVKSHGTPVTARVASSLLRSVRHTVVPQASSSHGASGGEPSEAELSTARSELATLEQERALAIDRGHHCSARAKRLLEDVQQLGLHAAKLVKAGDETTARKRLEEKASVHEHLVKAQDRATVNYRLAARLDALVGDKRNQLINLLERVGRRGPDQAALREQAAASSSAGSDALRASMPPSDQPSRGSTRKSDADIENAFLDVEREMLEKLIKSGSTSRYTARKRRPGMLRRDTESTKTSTPDTPKPQPADWPSTSYQPSSMPQPHRPPDRVLPPKEQRPQPSQPAVRSQPTDLQGSAGLPPWWPAGEREWRDELQSPDQQSISSTVQRGAGVSPSSSTYSSQQHASSQPHAESTLMSFALKCFDMRGDPASGPDAQSMSASTVQGSLVAMAKHLGVPSDRAVHVVHQAVQQHTQGAILASAQHMREVGNREAMRDIALKHVKNLMRVHKAVALPLLSPESPQYLELAMHLARNTYAIERTVIWEAVSMIYPLSDSSKAELKLILQAH